MNPFARELAEQRVREIARDLTQRGIEPPARFAEALAALDRVRALKPETPDAEALRAAYLKPDATRESVEQLAVRAVVAGRLQSAWAEAVKDAAMRALSAVSKAAADIIEQLRPAAEECVELLNWYGSQGAPDVGELLRRGRGEDAKRAAEAPLAWETFSALQKLRRSVTGSRFDWSRAGFWANPEAVEDAPVDGLPSALKYIGAGARLWWPTLDEAIALDARVRQEEERREAEAEARRKAQFHSAV